MSNEALEREDREVLLALYGPEFVEADIDWQKIAACLPKGVDESAVRTQWRAKCRRYKHEMSMLGLMGVGKRWKSDKKAHRRLISRARAFAKAYTQELDNLFEYVNGKKIGPRRSPLIAEVNSLIGWHEQYLREMAAAKKVGGSHDWSRHFFLQDLLLFWVELGGQRDSLAAERFLVNASMPVLRPEPLTIPAARDFIRGKKAAAAKPKVVQRSTGK